jgi:hypothetical protein
MKRWSQLPHLFPAASVLPVLWKWESDDGHSFNDFNAEYAPLPLTHAPPIRFDLMRSIGTASFWSKRSSRASKHLIFQTGAGVSI